MNNNDNELIDALAEQLGLDADEWRNVYGDEAAESAVLYLDLELLPFCSVGE